jgi:hypothetical protein
LQAAILLFVVGVIKCFHKPWALKSASINSLVTPSNYAQRRGNRQATSGTNLLEEYVQEARNLVHQAHEDEGEVIVQQKKEDEYIPRPSDLFVDLGYQYSDRFCILGSYLVLSEDQVYLSLQREICTVFSLIYTEMKSTFPGTEMLHLCQNRSVFKIVFENICSKPQIMVGNLIWMSRLVLPLTAACLLHKSHREAYNDADVKVTYALFVCGPLLEIFSVYYLFFVNLVSKATWLTKKVVQKPTPVWTGMVAQYSLIGYFTTGYIASLMECIDQQVSMTPCCSSRSITKWVLQHLKYGWMQYIDNTAGYWKFDRIPAWMRGR